GRRPAPRDGQRQAERGRGIGQLREQIRASRIRAAERRGEPPGGGGGVGGHGLTVDDRRGPDIEGLVLFGAHLELAAARRIGGVVEEEAWGAPAWGRRVYPL